MSARRISFTEFWNYRSLLGGGSTGRAQGVDSVGSAAHRFKSGTIWLRGYFPLVSNAQGLMNVQNNLYVGNMTFATTEATLRELFSQFGTVTKARLVLDKQTGRPCGFAFVEMSSGGDKALAALNGSQLLGRSITVNVAKPGEDRAS